MSWVVCSLRVLCSLKILVMFLVDILGMMLVWFWLVLMSFLSVRWVRVVCSGV